MDSKILHKSALWPFTRDMATDDKIMMYLRYLLGGGVLGAGIASGTNLAHMLNAEQQAKKDEDKDLANLDENTLTINLPAKRMKVAEITAPDKTPDIITTKRTTRVGTATGKTGKMQFRAPKGEYSDSLKKSAETMNTNWAQKLLALLTGAAGVAGGFGIADSLYNKYRRKKLEGEIDKLQQEYLTNLTETSKYKEAADKFNSLFKDVELVKEGTVGETFARWFGAKHRMMPDQFLPFIAALAFLGPYGASSYFTKRYLDLESKKLETEKGMIGLPKVKRIIFKTMPDKKDKEIVTDEPKLLPQNTNPGVPLDEEEEAQLKVAFIFALDRVLDNTLTKDASFRQALEAKGINVDECVKIAQTNVPVTNYPAGQQGFDTIVEQAWPVVWPQILSRLPPEQQAVLSDPKNAGIIPLLKNHISTKLLQGAPQGLTIDSFIKNPSLLLTPDVPFASGTNPARHYTNYFNAQLNATNAKRQTNPYNSASAENLWLGDPQEDLYKAVQDPNVAKSVAGGMAGQAVGNTLPEWLRGGKIESGLSGLAQRFIEPSLPYMLKKYPNEGPGSTMAILSGDQLQYGVDPRKWVGMENLPPVAQGLVNQITPGNNPYDKLIKPKLTPPAPAKPIFNKNPISLGARGIEFEKPGASATLAKVSNALRLIKTSQMDVAQNLVLLDLLSNKPKLNRPPTPPVVPMSDKSLTQEANEIKLVSDEPDTRKLIRANKQRIMEALIEALKEQNEEAITGE